LKEEIALLSEKHKMMKEVIYFRNMTMTIWYFFTINFRVALRLYIL
jgi:hypothetical protein